MPKKPLPGRDFQDLVAAIEKSLAPVEHKITSPMRIRDSESGGLREHDVVIDFISGRHPFRIAIEARDRGRKVGSGDVEGFRDKCRCTGIDRAIIVSSRGFTEPALKKANVSNVGCQTLTEAAAFDWCATRSVSVRRRDGVGTPRFQLDLGSDDAGPEPPVVCALDGTPWSDEARSATAQSWLFGLPEDENEIDGEIYTRNVRLDAPPLIAVLSDGRRVPVRSIVGVLSFQMALDTVPLQFHSYRTQAGAEVKCDLATAVVGGAAGRVVLTRLPDGNIQISLVAESDFTVNGPSQGSIFLGQIG